MRPTFRSRLRAVSPRDAILILLGAASMHFYASFSLLQVPQQSTSIILDAHLSPPNPVQQPVVAVSESRHSSPSRKISSTSHSPVPNLAQEIPQTELISHAPGWTTFRNLYMADGTLFIVTSNPESFPDPKLMTSTGLSAENTPESIADRMPTSRDMSVISPEEATRRWGGEKSTGEPNNIFPVEGPTVRLLLSTPITAHIYRISSFSMILGNVGCLRFSLRSHPHF